jgi:peroxiredoxin
VAQLRQSSEMIKELNTRVAIISFGTFPGAIAWLQETAVPFEFFLDPGRKAYQAYGLEHSMLRSWGSQVWINYARLMLSGRKWRGIQGDSAQLGGDFIIEKNGIVRLAYRSHDPTDRPSINELASLLQRLEYLGQTAHPGPSECPRLQQ